MTTRGLSDVSLKLAYSAFRESTKSRFRRDQPADRIVDETGTTPGQERRFLRCNRVPALMIWIRHRLFWTVRV